jgi:hypothetical protein
MSNKKQTAVDWLVSQQKHNQFFDIETIEIAKEMEKEQIKIGWNHGFDWGMIEQSLADQGEPSTLIDANHFYNETYGGK